MKSVFHGLFLIFSHCLFAQSIDKSIISSAGGLLVSADISMGFTIGESAVGYLLNNNSVDQGFWAGKGILVIPLSIEEEHIDIVVYPNPVVEELTVFSGNSEVLAIQLFSVNAQRVFIQTSNASEVEHIIDMSYLTKGVYILQLLIKGKGELKEYKIIKN
ncbi:T9SS type A sorting domain-containing protein [Pseudozobellia sp. WGM2]|uniref:T9SS type A sorting domain-containing protein n=1 Tax=Pseudozobellia sp. WGM2 TaxID=2787625 RepID=UPI001AE04922|nr:T9SS type A sorting domain-containing protein [Pseudozobellia sp. WGM2]